jgi:hypothetical protein
MLNAIECSRYNSRLTCRIRVDPRVLRNNLIRSSEVASCCNYVMIMAC